MFCNICMPNCLGCITALVFSWDDALAKVKTQKVYVLHVEEGEKNH